MDSCLHIKIFDKPCGSSLLPIILFGGGGKSGRNAQLAHSSAIDSCLILICAHKNHISIYWIVKKMLNGSIPRQTTDILYI